MSIRSRWVTMRPWVALLARLVLAGTLGYAGLSKIGDPVGSVRSVAAYNLFGDRLNEVIGYTLPFLELGLAVLLLAGLATRYAGVLSGLLLAAFVLGILSAWARGLSIDCGCFGGGGPVAPGEENYLGPLLRNLGLILLAGLLALRPRSPLALDGALGGASAGVPGGASDGEADGKAKVDG
jgi:uncharacterized membrane protein YphA (DoxX/SURF4 family)